MPIQELKVQDILKNYFSQKKEELETYSLREFSKHLDMHPSSLSKILKGQRGLPKAAALSVSEKLSLSDSEKKVFIDLVLNQSFKNKLKPPPLNHFVIQDEDTSLASFNIIAQWEYFAILNLIKLKNFKHTEKDIANRLGITLKRAKYCLNILIENHYIKIKDDLFIRLKGPLFTKNEEYSRALQLAHLQELEIAKEKINVSHSQKYYRSEFYISNTQNLDKIKKLTESYYQTVSRICDDHETEGENVYLLSTQLLPLSRINE